MRHRKAHRRLSRTAAHRRALFSNMLASLIEHGRIRTTDAKAKELRRFAEQAVARAAGLGEVLLKEPSDLTAEEKSRVVHATRMVGRLVKNRSATKRLFEDWAPRYLGRSGGYTRVLKIGNRKGDGAPVSMIEFVDAELPSSDSTEG